MVMENMRFCEISMVMWAKTVMDMKVCTEGLNIVKKLLIKREQDH